MHTHTTTTTTICHMLFFPVLSPTGGFLRAVTGGKSMGRLVVREDGLAVQPQRALLLTKPVGHALRPVGLVGGPERNAIPCGVLYD